VADQLPQTTITVHHRTVVHVGVHTGLGYGIRQLQSKLPKVTARRLDQKVSTHTTPTVKRF